MICDPSDAAQLERRQAALSRLAKSIAPTAHDAEDVVQDTWLAALRGKGEDVRDPDGWLYRVARYQAARATARRSRRPARSRRSRARWASCASRTAA